MSEPKDIVAEIDEMTKSLGSNPTPTKVEEKKEEKKEEDVSTKAPATEAPAAATQVPETKAPATTAPATAAPPEEDEEVRTLKAENERLKAELEASKKPKEPEPKVPTTQAPPAEKDFVGNMDLDELTRDPKEFNKFINKVYAQAVTDARKEVMSTLPDVVKTNITIMNQLQQASEQFYKDNPDLSSFKKVVATVFDEMVVADPNKPYSDLMKGVAPEVRKRLNLEKKDEKKPVDDKKVNPPRLPRSGSKPGRGSDKPASNPLQKDIEEMNKSIGR